MIGMYLKKVVIGNLKKKRYLKKHYIGIYHNNNEWKFKYSTNIINNLISKWKCNTSRFTRYYLIRRKFTRDESLYMRYYTTSNICKKYNNKIIPFECIIWGADC